MCSSRDMEQMFGRARVWKEPTSHSSLSVHSFICNYLLSVYYVAMEVKNKSPRDVHR